MYRSASTNRVPDDYSYYASSPSSKVPTALKALSQRDSELPMYEPLSEAAKKEKSRARFAENAVHIIPLVLLFCGFILWFFSNPDIVDLKGSSIGAKVEGMGIDGDLDSDGTGHLPVELGDLDPSKIGDAKNIFSQNKS
ncbi:UNVERIFIED_CONTAM: hypothetical protein Sradi_6272400 [Sesamum radiatum]|uniref:Transmembrane protein n=1 Tax=Sesamum radiatum TaxID=300843 RepID=A0AAW2KDV2_SESRA